MKDRLLSSSLVVSLGFLLLVSLVINGIVVALSGQLTRFLPGLGVYLISALNFVFSIAVVTIPIQKNSFLRQLRPFEQFGEVFVPIYNFPNPNSHRLNAV